MNVTVTILKQIGSITNRQKSALILDQYSGHKGDEIDLVAKKLNIQLIYVPVGQTSNLQPLDISINGALKSSGHKYIKDKYIDDPHFEPNINDGIRSLLYTINNIDKSTVKESFEKIHC